MKKLFLFSITIFSLTLNAAPPVTYQFTNGTTIEASQVNANYQELADRIEVLQSQVTQLQNIQPKQIIGFTTADASSYNPLDLTAQCQVEFADSRVCTSKEIIETIDVPTLPADSYARVIPVNLQPHETSTVISSYGGSISNYGECTTFAANKTSSTVFQSRCTQTGVKVACCR